MTRTGKNAIESQPVLPIDGVTLFEDRARVVRRGRLALDEGTHRLIISDVSPAIADKTVGARVSETASLSDIAVRRRIKPAHDEAADLLGELERERDGLEASIAAVDDDIELKRRELARTKSAAELLLVEVAEDVSWGESIPKTFAETLADVEQRELELRRQLVHLERNVVELREDLSRLDQRIANLAPDEDELVASLEIQLHCRGGEVEIEIDYMVPGACWRPYHRATLDTNERVIFETDACVWQNTGESWTDVELSLSTERSSQSSLPPSLDSDVLTLQKKSSHTVVEAREQEVQTTGLGGSDRRVPEVPGIDDAGERVTLALPSRVSVAATGRPHRFTISRCESEAVLERVAFPELSPHVHLKTTLTNENPVPLLAGPVDLIRNSGLAGRTSILYVASGERFEIGWGPEPDLRIKRVHDDLLEKSKMLSSWVVESHFVDVFVSNLADTAHSLRITERIPVSETEKVRVDCEGKDQPSPDEDGFVRWEVEVPPLGQLKRTLRYQIKKHDDVVGI